MSEEDSTTITSSSSSTSASGGTITPPPNLSTGETGSESFSDKKVHGAEEIYEEIVSLRDKLEEVIKTFEERQGFLEEKIKENKGLVYGGFFVVVAVLVSITIAASYQFAEVKIQSYSNQQSTYLDLRDKVMQFGQKLDNFENVQKKQQVPTNPQ